MKKWSTLSILIIALTTLTFIGCGGKPAESSANKGTGSTSSTKAVEKITDVAVTTATNSEESVIVDEVNIALGYDLSDLSPWSSATAGRNTVMALVYEYMAYYDATQESGLRGILMKDYEKVDDYTSRVTIYDYIYDSAGNHLTAYDVAWCFNTWKQMGKSVKCKLLQECTAIDDYTVEIKLTKDTVGDVENMLCGLVPIVTKAAYESSKDGMISDVISTSPYVVKDFVSGSNLTLEARNDYWQKDPAMIQQVSQANVKKIIYKIITESFQVPINLETNTIDITSQMSYSDASRFATGGSSSSGYKVYGVKDVNFYWLTFNCSDNGMFSGNQALRQAICYAIDTNGLITGVLSGAGEVAHAYANSICVDYNPEWDSEPYYEYDIEKAKSLLKESGFDTSKSIRIFCPNATIAKNTAQIIQSYLLQIGLKCEINAYDSALFQTYKTDPTQWDIMIDSKMSNDYVTSLASTLEVSGTAKALNFVTDQKLQDIVTKVGTVNGHTKEKIDEYMNYIKDQSYVYALFVPYNYYVVEDTITGIFTNFKGYLLPNACNYSEKFKR